MVDYLCVCCRLLGLKLFAFEVINEVHIASFKSKLNYKKSFLLKVIMNYLRLK